MEYMKVNTIVSFLSIALCHPVQMHEAGSCKNAIDCPACARIPSEISRVCSACILHYRKRELCPLYALDRDEFHNQLEISGMISAFENNLSFLVFVFMQVVIVPTF